MSKFKHLIDALKKAGLEISEHASAKDIVEIVPEDIMLRLRGESNQQFRNALEEVYGNQATREKMMGMDYKGFHGSPSTKIKEFKIDKPNSKELYGKGVYIADNADEANIYADILDQQTGIPDSDKSGAVYPLKMKTGKSFDTLGSVDEKIKTDLKKLIPKEKHKLLNSIEDNHSLLGLIQDNDINMGEFSNILKKNGYDSVDSGQGFKVALDPSQVRSKFAFFNPKFKDSSKIMAGGAGAALMLGDSDEAEASSVPKSKQIAQAFNLSLDEVTKVVKQFGEEPFKILSKYGSAEEVSDAVRKGDKESKAIMSSLEQIYGAKEARKWEISRLVNNPDSQAVKIVKNTTEDLAKANPAFKEQILNDQINTLNNTQQANRIAIKGGAARAEEAAFDPRYKHVGGKGTEYAGIAAIPSLQLSTNPLDTAKSLYEKYSNVKDKVVNYVTDQLMPEQNVPKDSLIRNVGETTMGLVLDPVNLVSGPAGAAIGAGELLLAPEQPLEGYAEGGMVQDMPAFDQTMDIPQERLPAFDETEDASKYETPGQIALTAVEGVAEGLAGPLAPLIQTELGQNPDDIRARAALNPITKGVGEATGLGLGMLTGTGEAAVMSKAGQAITKAAGLAEKTSVLGKIGSKIVQEAVENMVQQGSDEISKVILKDPDASMQSAMGNIGLAGVLGGALGGAMGGTSELWKATAGKKLDTTLNTMYDRMSGKTLFLPEELEASMKAIGVDNDPLLRAAVSKDPNLVNKFNVLKEVQNSEVLASIDNAHKQAEKAVLNTLGVDPNEMMYYSRAEAGNDLLETFKKEYDAKYSPFEKKFKQRNQEAATIIISDDDKIKNVDKLIEDAIMTTGTDSPYFKEFQDYGQRVLAKETVGELDMLKTEINNRIKGLKIGGDYNVINTLNKIKDSISDMQEKQIIKEAKALGKEGLELADSLLKEREMLNKEYSKFASMSDELTNHLGVGDFYGAKTLENKLTDKLSAEQLLNKFSIKNNADFIPFLQQNFPETFKAVTRNEFKEFVKPAFLSAKEGQEINVKKLADLIDKGLAGKKEYVESLISPDTMSMVKSATDVLTGIPSPKSSGTAGWMTKVFDKMPQSALAGAAAIMGQNPLLGYLAGEVAQATGRNIPDAIRLAYLKFMASDKPVQSTAFKAMVEAIHDTYKFENKLGKATKNLFNASVKTVVNDIPDQESRDKLVKKLKKLEENPYALMDSLGNTDLAHYMPNHQASLAASATGAVQYLQALKPQPYKPSVLDKPIEPSEAQKQRYYRALDIAQNPLVVLQHIKDGTLQTSDIEDLNGMYPYLYSKYVTSITNEISNLEAADKQMPYKQRVSTSLFLGQALDTTMQPSSILAAQAVHQQKITNQQQGPAPGASKNTAKLGKINASYMTPLQRAETNKLK